MDFEKNIPCKEDAKDSCTTDDANAKFSMQNEAYAAMAQLSQTQGINPFNNVSHGQIQQEGRYLGLLLDSGNGPLAAMRLQNDLYQLRPSRYAQNLLLNNTYFSDNKGIGSDLVLGQYNPYTQAYSQGYIIQSVFRPLPIYPVYY